MKLAKVDALPQLALLGIASGLATGVIIVLFRQAIELPQTAALPLGDPENYEALDWKWRLGLPIVGSLCIGILLQNITRIDRQVGVAHVIERLSFHQAHLPLRNVILQFFTGVIAIISGHSVGREGPGIHLGAATSSLIGQWMSLPNNSIRVLVACGTAASISASFNTPIAGVIFAMEVILIEYTASTVIPVILASFMGALVTRAVYGLEPAFVVPSVEFTALAETPLILLLGVLVGCLAVAFIQLVTLIAERGEVAPIWLRTLVAGIFVGVCSLLVPQIMGIGYDTISSTMIGEFSAVTLLSIVAFKLMATSVCVGSGIPGGLIGPTLFIGAVTGGLMNYALPDGGSSTSLYVLLGMCGMMSAVLQAPLSALLCILELSGNPTIIFPGMLVIVTSNLIASELFSKQSIFSELAATREHTQHTNSMSQTLLRAGVASIMDRSFVTHDLEINFDAAKELLNNNPRWVVIYRDLKPVSVLIAADLARYLLEEGTNKTDERFNLMDIPGQRYEATPINLQASLLEAHQLLERPDSQLDALYVQRPTAPGIYKIYGIITPDLININYSLHAR